MDAVLAIQAVADVCPRSADVVQAGNFGPLRTFAEYATEQGLPAAHDTALAKLACNEAGFFAANESMQVPGGTGFSEERLAQYCVRRTRGGRVDRSPQEPDRRGHL